MIAGGFPFYVSALASLMAALWWTRRRHDEVLEPRSRVAALALVAAFLVLSIRAVLMMRWPLLAAADGSAAVGWLPSVGLPHHLVVELALFAVGLLAASTHRDLAAVRRGLTLMLLAAAVALLSVVRFVGGQGGESGLVVVVLVATAATVFVSRRIAASEAAEAGNESTSISGGVVEAPLDRSVSTTVLAVLAGVTLALLAGAW